MEQNKSNRTISIDSETGFYWNGQNPLRHKTLIKTVIEDEMSRKYGVREQTSLHIAAPETARTAG